MLPDYRNSNVEVMRQFAKGGGAMVGDRPNKIFLLLDGFGYNLLERVVYRDPVLREVVRNAQVSKATTVFPSFTISAISSIDSGMSVAEHGIAGDEIPVKEAGTIISMLGYSTAMNGSMRLDDAYSRFIYPKPKMISLLKRRHKFAYVQDEYILKKEYSRTMFEGVESVPYVSFEDMLFQVAKLVRGGGHDRVYAYHSIIDHAEHTYTPDSPEVAHIVSSALLSIKRLLLPLLYDNDFNLVITADHGQIPVRSSSRAIIKATDRIMGYLNMPSWGMSRTPILSAFPGKEKALEEYFSGKYGKKGILVESDEAIRAGVFGRKYVDARLRPRFGTHVVIAKGDSVFKYQYPGKVPKLRKPRFGHHGGMSRDEMEVPVITY